MMNFLGVHYFREYDPKDNGFIYKTIQGAFDKIPGGNNFGDSEKVSPSEDLEVNKSQTQPKETAPVSNTAAKINLKCSDYNGGYGSSFSYNGQKVKKINDNWNSNNSWRFFCQADK